MMRFSPPGNGAFPNKQGMIAEATGYDRKSRIPGRALSVLACSWTVATAAEPSYTEHIKPLFAKYCVECHGIEAREAGLDLRTRESLLQGGDSGAAIVPGKPAASLLLKQLKGEIMPPEGVMPTAAEIDTVRRWIAAGAPK